MGYHHSHKPFKHSALVTLLTVATASMVLTGCNSGTDSSVKDKKDEHKIEKVAPEGRLALLQSPAKKGEKPTLSIIDNKTGKELKVLSVANNANHIYSSPNNRYVLLSDRAGNSVTFADGGLYSEDHSDHDHPYAKTPSNIGLKFDKIAPTHYQAFEGKGAIFFDGDRKAEPNKVSSIAVFSDTDIGKITPVIFDLPNSMHGTAEPRGDYLLTTVRNAGKHTALPDEVVLYKKDKESYKKVANFPKAVCEGLHGSASNEDYTLFGCTDGVLSVKQAGDTFTVTKIANTADINNIEAPKPSNKRIGKLVGHEESDSLIGTAYGHPFVIKPSTNAITKLTWAAEAGTTVKASIYDAQGEHILLIDSKGKLHIHDTKTLASQSVVDLKIKANPSYGSSDVIKLVVNGSHDDKANHAYILDTYKVGDAYKSRLLTVDIEEGKFTEKALPKVVSSISWLGVKTEHDHKH